MKDTIKTLKNVMKDYIKFMEKHLKRNTKKDLLRAIYIFGKIDIIHIILQVEFRAEYKTIIVNNLRKKLLRKIKKIFKVEK